MKKMVGMCLQPLASSPNSYVQKLNASKLSMASMKKLLAEACQRISQDDTLAEFTPCERRWIESSHLTLNMGNTVYEHIQNTLHVLFPDASRRNLDKTEADPDAWPTPIAGSNQSVELVKLGSPRRHQPIV
jgi:hypothetical protein